MKQHYPYSKVRGGKPVYDWRNYIYTVDSIERGNKDLKVILADDILGITTTKMYDLLYKFCYYNDFIVTSKINLNQLKRAKKAFNDLILGGADNVYLF